MARVNRQFLQRKKAHEKVDHSRKLKAQGYATFPRDVPIRRRTKATGQTLPKFIISDPKVESFSADKIRVMRMRPERLPTTMKK